MLSHQVVVVLDIWGATVQGLPLDAQDGVDLLGVHVVGACGETVPEGLMVVMGAIVTPPTIATTTHVGVVTCIQC